MVDWAIPGNDDAIKAIRILTAAVADAYFEGRQVFEKKSAKEAAAKQKEEEKEALKKEKEAAVAANK